MAFNKENKVTYAELAPSLQEMINKKLNDYDFSRHINDKIVHITEAEREYWNSLEKKAREYTDSVISNIVGSTAEQIEKLKKGQSGFGSLLDNIAKCLLESDFEEWKKSLNRVAFSGSYNDLKDLPSAMSYSDSANNANHAKEADHALTADHAKSVESAEFAKNSALVNNIRVTVGPTAPTNPINDREIWYDTTELFIKFWHNGEWQYTGAALR